MYEKMIENNLLKPIFLRHLSEIGVIYASLSKFKKKHILT